MLIDKGYTPTTRNWTPGYVRTNLYIMEKHEKLSGGFITPPYVLNLEKYKKELEEIEKDTRNLLYEIPDEIIGLKRTIKMNQARQYIKNDELSKLTPEKWEIIHFNIDEKIKEYEENVQKKYWDFQFG